MKFLFCVLFALCDIIASHSQSCTAFADSIRLQYHIPELAFAVVSADSVFEMETMGVQRINSRFAAQSGDRFHIGSNTKAITSFIAALMVERRQIAWDTKFFSLFPELKVISRKEYNDITLQDLLSFRGKLPAYTYSFAKPGKKQIRGSEAGQRYELAKYFLQQAPMQSEDGYTPSNADYILAGLMLEKASGKPFKTLVTDFGDSMHIGFGFDYPNVSDTLQPWGHGADLKPLPPTSNYKLNWLLSAGNINISLPDYVRFIRLQLTGLKGESSLLTPRTFDKLLYGLPIFSFGWFNKKDSVTNHTIAWNEGNAGAFITRVEISKEANRAYIIFTNSATEETGEGIGILMDALQNRYGK